MLRQVDRARLRQDAAAERIALAEAGAKDDELFRMLASMQLERAIARGCKNVIPIARLTIPPPAPLPRKKEGTTYKKSPGNPHPGNTQARMGFSFPDSTKA